MLVAGICGCMACRPCRTGRVNACETWARVSPDPAGPGLGFDGGMPAYMVAPVTALFDLGDLDPVATTPLADVVIDFVGVDATLRTAIGAARTYGEIVNVGLGNGNAALHGRRRPVRRQPPVGCPGRPSLRRDAG